MAKVTKVTNDQERDAMQDRIINAALHISNPLLDKAEKQKLMPVYDEMVSQMKAFDRAQYCKQYPGVREIYEQLGWVVAELPDEDETTTPADPDPLPPQEEPKQVKLSSWLDDDD